MKEPVCHQEHRITTIEKDIDFIQKVILPMQQDVKCIRNTGFVAIGMLIFAICSKVGFVAMFMKLLKF